MHGPSNTLRYNTKFTIKTVNHPNSVMLYSVHSVETRVEEVVLRS